jgi:hypothetical protein
MILYSSLLEMLKVATPFVVALIFMDKDACNDYVVPAKSHMPMLVEQILSVTEFGLLTFNNYWLLDPKKKSKNLHKGLGLIPCTK